MNLIIVPQQTNRSSWKQHFDSQKTFTLLQKCCEYSQVLLLRKFPCWLELLNKINMIQSKLLESVITLRHRSSTTMYKFLLPVVQQRLDQGQSSQMEKAVRARFPNSNSENCLISSERWYSVVDWYISKACWMDRWEINRGDYGDMVWLSPHLVHCMSFQSFYPSSVLNWLTFHRPPHTPYL
jgi:hypothetical protein